jgi:hypothetical protein
VGDTIPQISRGGPYGHRTPAPFHQRVAGSRLGDFLAGTIVVHDKSQESVTPSWGHPATSQPAQPELRKLAPNDLVLIETYLNRRFEVDAVVRATTAQRIVAMVAQKTGMAKPADQRDDDFLETIARQLRDTASFR